MPRDYPDVPLDARRLYLAAVVVPPDLAGTMSPGVVARQLGVGRATVNRWLTDGVLPARGRTAAGHYRVDARVVDALKELRQRGLFLDARTLKAHRDEMVHATEEGS